MKRWLLKAEEGERIDLVGEKNTMINIAFIASKLQVGGAERQLQELINNINKQKFNITVICLYNLDKIGEEIKRSGIKCYSNILRSRFFLPSMRTLIKILRDEKINLCFIWNQPLTMFYGVIAAKCVHVDKIITAIHSTISLERMLRKYFINKLLIRFVDKIIAVGTNQREYLIQREHFPPEKITVIFNGVDIDKYQGDVNKENKKRELGISRNYKVVGLIGRLHACKRHDIFLRAARLVVQQYPNVIFSIVGDGEERRNIETLIEKLDLGQHVRMLGFRRDIIEITKILDISVLSSDTEALPMTIIESMASHVPVVATEVGSVPDLIMNGENGILIPPHSPERLAEAILRILNNEPLAHKMGENGYHIAYTKFSVESMVANYERLFMGVDL